MLRRIFLVDADPQSAAPLACSLVHEHYSVSVVSSFEEVCALAADLRPDLLITSVRLGRFNGLHLAARFRADYPGLPMVVLGEDREFVFAAEAMQLHARFVPKSTPCAVFLRYIDDLINDRNPRDLVSTRRWPRYASDFAAGFLDGTVRVSDVGYGGLRIECEVEPPTDVPIDIGLPTLGMNVTGICRWSHRADDRTWTCGIELEMSTTDARKWRQFVDSDRMLMA